MKQWEQTTQALVEKKKEKVKNWTIFDLLNMAPDRLSCDFF